MLKSLQRRLRTRRAPPAAAPAPGRAVDPPPWDPAQHDVPAYPRAIGPVTRALRGRLDAEDVRILEERLQDAPAAYWAQADDVMRAHLTLCFGAHYRIEPILDKTGLSPAMPPDAVHAMARGPLAAGGDPYLADLVLGSVERAGRTLADGARALDFGCSSGRVVRVFAAALPGVDWLGCDPNPGAISWAAEHLPGVEFFVSPQEPQLDLATGSLDLIYAISIWSHFDAEAGLRWLAEMHRLLRPGGLLVITTHGIGSLGRQIGAGTMIPDSAARCAEALYRSGFWFVEVFGKKGDYGVVSPEWGMAYMTPEWLLARVLPSWIALLYEPARLDANQDLYVLERR